MSLSGFLTQSIIIKNPTGSSDRHGKDALGAAVNAKARFERKFKTTIDKDKERQAVHGMFIVGPSTSVLIGAQIEYDGVLYRVLERNDAPGRAGTIHHLELMCQYWSYA